MAGRKPILEHEEAGVHAALVSFNLRDQALIAMGLNTGFRITELLSLNVGDVWSGNGPRREVKVTRAHLKGGRGRFRKSISSRAVPLNAAATGTVTKYLFTRFGSTPADLLQPLFLSRKHGLRLSRWQANRIVHAVLAKAGLMSQESYGTHTLRKTFCRKIYHATGHDINLTRAVMGHTSVATTQRYLPVDDQEISAAVMSLAARPSRPILVAAG
ncbi:MAG TPA: tyrosine-type recombinase/integrase [Opitutaceae bacterium]|nr:tyrosine-type recombinase/integrase [Opitutaceae bacterium]